MKKIQRSTITRLLLSTLYLGLIPTSALGFTLDLFKDVSPDPDNNAGSQIIDLTWPTTSGNNPIDGLTDVVWGKRSLYLDIASNNPGLSSALNHGSIFQVATDGSSFGVADLSSDTSIIASAAIDWDGWDTGDDYINLEDNGDDSLVLQVIGIDQGVDLKFTITDQNDQVATITETVTSTITSSQPIYFAYTDASSSIDLNNVKQIRLDIENASTTALDFTFDILETGVKPVPFEFSPSLGIFMSVGFFAFYRLRKASK